MYDGYHFWGMHLIWWFVWIVFIGAMFGWYDQVPKSRGRKNDRP